MLRRLPLVLLALVCLMAPVPVQAFCGFYVAGADAKLFNDATMVVLMREGRRTILSMQNSYAGPAEDFAMIVPVPVVLDEDNVKILPQSVFDRVDRLAAPRLVEYWEQDPCFKPRPTKKKSARKSESLEVESKAPPSNFGVTIEAQFEVGEYEVVILSAKDSTGLDGWLRQEDYSIPQGSEALLRPYVQDGYKFFVAKVDVDKVKFVNGRVALSPLRVHYDSDSFNLPIRLGLINASSKTSQDLIVHILAEDRYETANYSNVAIPTNLEVKDQTRKNFGSFYASLFDHTLRQHPGAVVTEYAWAANSCDPCPEPPLGQSELTLLGADALPNGGNARSMTLTRLHARYDSKSLGNDLVFQVAKPIVGGRERVTNQKGELEIGAVPDRYNNFQARYIIRHRWQGKITCQNPIRDRWGGPWNDKQGLKAGSASAVGEDLAFVKRGATLNNYVKKSARPRTSVDLLSEGDSSLAPPPVPEPEPEPEPEANTTANEPDEPEPEPEPEVAPADPDAPDSAPGDAIDDGPDTPEASGCAHCTASDGGFGALGLAALSLFGLLAIRRTSS